MIQNSLLSYLKSESKKFSNKDIFDIVIYGSCMMSKEEPGDVDIALIFFDKKLSERLKISQEFKNKIRSKINNPDVRGINLSELFDTSFLARQGILTEGY